MKGVWDNTKEVKNMDIIKHKSLDLTMEQLYRILQGDIPDGIAVDNGDGFISISPEDETNLFGEYGGDTDYELIAYKE